MSYSNANRKDPAWYHGTLPNPNDTNKVKCNYCGKVTNGGISRFKKHLVGGYKEVNACGDCPPPIMGELKEYMANKKESKRKMNAIPHFDKLDDEVIFNACVPNTCLYLYFAYTVQTWLHPLATLSLFVFFLLVILFLRVEVSQYMQLLIQIVCELPPEHPVSSIKPLRDSLGHTPVQVVAALLMRN